MSRWVWADALVGSYEIAAKVGLRQRETVNSWLHRYPDFPKPVVTLKKGMIWYWPDVLVWLEATGRLPGQEAPPAIAGARRRSEREHDQEVDR